MMNEQEILHLQEIQEKMSEILKQSQVIPFEYRKDDDLFIVYTPSFEIKYSIPHYLDCVKNSQIIHPEDRWKMVEFYQERLPGPLEIRVYENNEVHRKIIYGSINEDSQTHQRIFLGCCKDISYYLKREKRLEEQAQRDSLTSLYNQSYGKKWINEYLNHKNPYDSCGLMVIDIDYFKKINDNYGHLYGDQVLKRIAELLVALFDNKDIIMRAGGDEFVILIKEITQASLVKKAMKVLKAVSHLKLEKGNVTCSIGVCFLPENVSGYHYDQIFKNADWALYRAKEYGRNQYVFCDHLQRYEMIGKSKNDIDATYFDHHITSIAFDIFEKSNSFDNAISLLFDILSIRYQLDRITIIQTNIKDHKVNKYYQWKKDDIPEALPVMKSFTKEDFLTLFHSYDDNGITVLQEDDMDMYSSDAKELLMQGEAKTVVYAAMYCEGQYIGAISYVVCRKKRHWNETALCELGELTKIISVHLAKHLAIQSSHYMIATPGLDRLTGLLAFSKFREEVERFIVGGFVKSHVMIYSDFENFKYINQKYDYALGDQLLKEFSHFLMERLQDDKDVFATRVVADQFILFMPYDDIQHASQIVHSFNQEFIQQCKQAYPGINLKIRSGIYHVTPECLSASQAIDAANYARRETNYESELSATLYNEQLDQKRLLRKEIITGMDKALRNHEFKVYMQPKFSLYDFSIIGAEALVRWKKEDGTLLYPDSFIPIYEENGRIIDLDFYVFEEVVKFLDKNNQLGRKQVPISINASILHAHNEHTADHYLKILNKYHVDPSLVEIELTETDTISAYDNVKKMFHSLTEENISTALDDFGAGYSILNSVVEIPVDTIKIDKEFVKNCEISDKGIYFLQQLIMVLKQLGYQVICEGVETQKQINILKEAGCEVGQGYFFCRPVPMEEYEKKIYHED